MKASGEGRDPVYCDHRGGRNIGISHRTMTTPESVRVMWTRGKGCHELAEALGGSASDRISGDISTGCISQRADLLVSRKLPSGFDLVNIAVPIGYEPDRVTKVVAAVAGGPHSELSVETARRLATSLGVEAEMVSAARSDDEIPSAAEILDQIASRHPQMAKRVVVVDGVGELVEDLDEGTLLVLGAAGGSWLSRSRTGPGAKLRRTAQAGAIVVRSAPDRVFRFMDEPIYVAPLRQADDTLRLHPETTLAVADEGRLVGLVRRDGLIQAGTDPVATVMEEALSAKVDETLVEAAVLEPEFGGDPIPVTDHDEHLVGALSLPRG